MNQPKKWTDVYPYGTKEGDEEAKVFRCLARHPKYEYRSVPQIVKTTGLTRERVEEIIDKYANMKPALIYPHPTNDDCWGYWERCPEVLKKDDRSLSKKDKDNRIDKHMGTACTQTGKAGSAPSAAAPVAQSTQIPTTLPPVIVIDPPSGQTLPDIIIHVPDKPTGIVFKSLSGYSWGFDDSCEGK